MRPIRPGSVLAVSVLSVLGAIEAAGCGSSTGTTSITTVTSTVTVTPSVSSVSSATTPTTAATAPNTVATTTSATGTTTVAAPAATLPVCDHTMWTAAPVDSEGAAGTIYLRFQIHNIAGFACTTRGYPGITLVGANGRALNTMVARQPATTDQPLTMVTLPASGIGYFDIGYSNVDRTPGACPASTAVQVIPPNTVQPLTAHFPRTGPTASGIPTCTKRITVTPVELGAGKIAGE